MRQADLAGLEDQSGQEDLVGQEDRAGREDLAGLEDQLRQEDLAGQADSLRQEEPAGQEDLAGQADRAGQSERAGQADRAGQSELAQALGELTSGDDERAETAVPQLAALAEQALPTLEALLHSPAAERRWWAVRVLAELDSPQASRLLRQGLSDPDGSVRQCAALALRHRPTPEAIPELLANLASPDRLLARLSADALAAAGSSAIPQLIEVMESGPQTARLEAVRALARSGDPSAIPALFNALDAESALMEYWAGEGLERLGVGMSFFNP